MLIRTILAGLAVAQVVAAPAQAQDPATVSSYVALPRPEAPEQITYGPLPSQGIDVFVPAGSGPHPVAILVHGGCWRVRPGIGREQLRHLGADLASRGIAVWSIGYRRATEEGGGYPGTYQDVADAIDRLRTEASRYRLDLARTVMVGHSAGGHLALWAASRASLPAESPLHRPTPFIPKAVISVAGIGDLKSFAKFVPVICEPGILERMTGTSDGSAGPPRFPEVSPGELSPPPGPVILINGILDATVPPFAAFDYTRAVRSKRQGQPVEMVEVPGVGHFDFFIPGTSAWALLNRRIDEELGRSR